jgi:hypothetical protein
MPTYQFYEVPGTLIGILSVLGFWAVLLGVWLIVAMFVTTLWAIILIPFVAPLVLCVDLLRIILSLAMNHFPWFVVLVLTAYIVATRDWTSSKQEPRHNTMPDSTPAKQDLQHKIFHFPAFVREESQHKTLDEIMIEIQSREWKSLVEETRQANPRSFTRDGNGW